MERDRYWDVIKGLGIIAVVLGHAGVQGYFVSLYHLPLFFFVAGYFYNDKYSTDAFAFFGKKLRSLWWPMFKYMFFFVILHNAFVYLHFIGGLAQGNFLPGEYYGKSEMLGKVILAFWGQHLENLGGPMWFIFPLLIGLLYLCIVRNMSMRLPMKMQSYVSAVLIMILYILGILIIQKQVPSPFWCDLSLIVLPIIYAGFMSKNYIKRLVPENIIFLLLGVLISIGILQYCINNDIIIMLSDKKYYNPIVFLVVTLIGIYMNLLLGRLICKVNILMKIFSHIGAKSFHIMALHFLCFKLVNFVYIFKHNLPYTFMSQVVITSTFKWWPLYLLAGVGMPLGLVYMYDYCKSKLGCVLKIRFAYKSSSR